MIWLDGRLVAAEQAKVSVFDRGFLYGDGLFETLPVYAGTPFLLQRHLDRLQRGAQALRFANAPSAADWRVAVAAVIAAHPEPESTLRLWLSRGTGVGLACGSARNPTWIAACLPARRYEPRVYAQGVAVFASERIHALPEQAPTASKHANYLASILAFDDAHARGADEALLCNARGDVCEGAYSNLFFVVDGVLTTPPLSDGALAGTARACLLELAATLGLPVAERSLPIARLDEVEEAFMSNALIGLAPIQRVLREHAAELRWPAPGPIARRLSAAYAELVRAHTGLTWPLLQAPQPSPPHPIPATASA